MTVMADATGEDLAPAPAAWKTDSLAASMTMLLVLTVVQRGVGFLRGILFCRWLDAEQLGQWDMAFGFLMLAAPLAVLGIPGSLGRYVEHYRQRGQLRPFLFRVGTCIAALAALAVAVAMAGRGWLADLVFGSPQYAGLMLLVAAGLGIVTIDFAMTSLFTALRQVRFVAIMQFTNSLIFAMLGVGLLLTWQASTQSVVWAFAGASLVTASVSLAWLARIWPSLPAAGAPLSTRSLGAKLLPFAFALWVTNWLANLFSIADRFMIVHYSGLGPDAALNMVGQYHTARVFPVLLIGVAELLGAVITPHLSADWEAGRRADVSRRLGLILKSFGVALVAGSLLVLAVAPVLFNHVWQHRYGEGLSVLPWALVGSIWTGLAFISYNYLWCVEKSRFVCLTLAVGLVLNVVLNLALLPSLGLWGAVLAMAASRLAALALLWWLTRRLGMQVDGGLIVVAALPLLLTLGPWFGLAAVAVVALGLVPGLGCFNAWEKEQLLAAAAHAWSQAKALHPLSIWERVRVKAG